MKFRRIVLGGLATAAMAAVALWFSLDKETRGLLATVPTNRAGAGHGARGDGRRHAIAAAAWIAAGATA